MKIVETCVLTAALVWALLLLLWQTMTLTGNLGWSAGRWSGVNRAELERPSVTTDAPGFPRKTIVFDVPPELVLVFAEREYAICWRTWKDGKEILRALPQLKGRKLKDIEFIEAENPTNNKP